MNSQDATTEALLRFSQGLIQSAEKQAKIPDVSQDPIAFVRSLGVTPWSDIFDGEDKLSKIINQVFSGKKRFTVVESGNGVGKSTTAAAIVCAWLQKYEQAAIVTLAPTANQVNNILWRNIRQMYHKVGILPGQPLETPKWNISPERFAIGLSPRRATQEDLQSLYGYHSPNLLVILDEAPGLPRMMWEAIQRLVTAENNRVLALGNPIGQIGPFWEACNDENWEHIRISCFDHPNVVKKKDLIEGATGWNWVDERVKEHCARAAKDDPGAFEWEGQWWQPNAVFQSMVLGQAPTEGTDQLISLAWVTSAQSWVAEPDENEIVVIGLDPSRSSHGDAAAMVARQGARVLWVKRRRPSTGNPTDELAGWLRDEYVKAGAIRAYIEETGVGGGVIDKCRNLGISVMPVNPGGGASSRQWANKRAECWWRMMQQLQGGALSLPQDDLLAADLTAPKYNYDGTGRILLEPKEKIKARLGRSPDSGDALGLTFALDISAQGRVPEKSKNEMPGSRWTVGVKQRGRGRWR